MPETVFSKIIRGELPCHKVYEDDKVLAFLDINPLCEGHTLVIPKEEVATLDQLSDESAAAIGRVLPRISRAVLSATGATEFNVLAEQRPRRAPGRVPRAFPHHPEVPRRQGARHRLEAGPARSRARQDDGAGDRAEALSARRSLRRRVPTDARCSRRT